MKTSSVSICCLVTCFLIAAALQPTHGQTGDTLSDLRDFIQRNAELLQHAKALVSETNSVKARASLQTAAALHQQSVTSLNTGDTNHRAGQEGSKAGGKRVQGDRTGNPTTRTGKKPVGRKRQP
jgi:hypothetical protein